MPRSFAAAVALVAALAPAAAQANMAAVQRHPSRVVGPKPARATELRVEHERLLLLCWETEKQPLCTFEAHYKLHNPTREREETAVAFYGVATRAVTITVDGKPATGRLGPEDVAALDKAVVATGPEAPSAGRIAGGKHGGERFDRAGFVLVAEPGSRHEVVVKGQMVPGRRFVPRGYGRPAVEARHLLFSRAEETVVHDLEYMLWPLKTWKGDPRVEVQIVHPATWKIQMGGDDAKRWTQGREGESVVLTRALKASELPLIDLGIELPQSSFHPGGVLLGVGGTVGPTRGVRARVGYEVAAPSFLLYSINAETDFRERFIFTPLIEAATPAAFILPSFGFGVGAPLQVKRGLTPETRVGVRLQGDLHFFPVGFVTSVDLYPKMGASTKGYVEASFLAQIGL